MDPLRFTSCQAESEDSHCRSIARYLAGRLGLRIEFVGDVPWRERERMLDAGEIQAGWICGLSYVWRADRPPGAPIELLAAPVMSAPRYAGRPVYFSDVVVRRSSRFRFFEDLRGAIWAYNEPNSHSGYNAVRDHLAALGETAGYFRRVIESGAREMTLCMILDGQIDASAIDSTVLESAVQRFPAIRSRLRVVETLGPSPVPPWVVLRTLPQELRSALRTELLTMHLDPQGSAVLARAQMSHFATVADQDYDPIRRMAQEAERVAL
jgi:phosphonate transport system substrate-binding protein